MIQNKASNPGTIFLVTLTLSIASSLVLSFAIAIVSVMSSVNLESLLSNEVYLYISAILPQICFFSIYLYFRHRYGSTPIFAGRKTYKWHILVPVVIILSILTLFGSLNSTYLFTHLLSFIAKPKEIPLVVDNVPTLVLSTLFMCLLPAIVEELLFRGVLFRSFRQRFALPVAVFFTALSFALMHMSMFSFLHQFLLGIVLALLAYYTRSLICGIIFHFVNNFSIILIEYIFADSVPMLISDYSVVNIFIILGILILTIGIIFAFFLYLSKIKRGEDNVVSLDEIKHSANPRNVLVTVSFIVAIFFNIVFTLLG